MKLLAIVSDTHVNGKTGLCPPRVEVEGGEYIPSESQQAIWQAWEKFWNLMARKAMENNCDLVAAHLGDVGDTVNGKPRALICHEPADVSRLCVQAMAPTTQAADAIYIVRGTEAHSGPACWIEEAVGQAIGAQMDPETGLSSFWWLPLIVEGVHFDLAHHPHTYGSRPWTAQSAAARESAIIAADYTGRGSAPDVVARGHVHYAADSGLCTRPRVVYCPPWQLTTAFGYRCGAGGKLEPVGGWWFLCDQGRILAMDLEKWEPRRREWITS